MRLRRPIAFILSAAVAASALTGCDSFSGHAATAANSAQVQQLIEFIADLGLERDLRQALQKGGDLRQALLTLLGLESAVNFNVDGLTSARPGQHAVQVWEVTAQSAEDAAALAASQIRAVLEQLKSSGVTEGRIGMVEVDSKYYVVVDVEVTEENTFEPIRPASSDDDDDGGKDDSEDGGKDDSEDGGKDDSEDDDDGGKDDSEDDTILGVTVENGLLIVDVAKLELDQSTDITAESIIEAINKKAETSYGINSIKVLDLSDTQITTIDDEAFKNCSTLTEIILPKILKTIGESAFDGCNSLTSINLSDCTNLQSIGDGAFHECRSLTSIDLSGCTSLTTIDYQAFWDCDGLTSIDLSDCTSLTTIGQSAFEDCSKLTSITLSGCTDLQIIGHYAFNHCRSLTSIDLSDCTRLQWIGDYAFNKCFGLTEINLSGCTGLESIGIAAFWGCSGLENIYFYNVPAIKDNAFFGVISDGKTLIIHCPSGQTGALKEKLKASGLTQAEIDKITFREDSTLTYPFGF